MTAKNVSLSLINQITYFNLLMSNLFMFNINVSDCKMFGADTVPSAGLWIRQRRRAAAVAGVDEPHPEDNEKR